MSDLISRQAAIDAVKKNTFRLTFAEEQNCEGHLAWSANAVYSDVIEGALLELPSAQPETTERTTETAQNVSDRDLISRKAAIDAIRASTSKYTGFMEMEMYTDDDAVEAIEALPSAQPAKGELADVNHYFLEGVQLAVDVVEGMPEPKDAENGSMPCPDARNSHDRTTDDCISRQAAIDALGERPMLWVESDYELGARNQYDADVLAIETVPAAQSFSCDHENDTISRQSAIDAFDGVKVDEEDCTEYDIGYNDGIDFAVSRLSVLPSAQPEYTEQDMRNQFNAGYTCGMEAAQPERKRGHWVGIDDEPCETWECDKCGCIHECFDGEQPNFCPQCGSDMRR